MATLTSASTTRRRRPQLTREVASLFPPQGEWTEEVYLSLPETNRIIELSEGRLVIPEMPTYSHQYVVGELFVRMHAFVGEHCAGHVGVAPLRVHLGSGTFREPDIVFMSADHAERIGEAFWGVPDLVVDVISPRTERSSGTEQTDRVEKVGEYAQAGVAEYWLVDPRERTIEVYVLRQGRYGVLGTWGVGEVARSEVLAGLEVPVGEVMVPVMVDAK